jgi:hypothetical protein
MVQMVTLLVVKLENLKIIDFGIMIFSNLNFSIFKQTLKWEAFIKFRYINFHSIECNFDVFKTGECNFEYCNLCESNSG